MKRKILTTGPVAFFVALIIASSTAKLEAANVVRQASTQAGSPPPYFQVLRDNTAMRNAVIEARKTLGEFIKALKHPSPGQQEFEVKKVFTQGNQIEHIWISDVQIAGPHLLQGRVDNESRKIKGIELGQVVTVDPKEISDWLYVDNGNLIGGYTLRVHYNQLSPAERAEFDREANFKLGKQ
jgi:uncharacterized protein YegJ (DUF2314 family)